MCLSDELKKYASILNESTPITEKLSKTATSSDYVKDFAKSKDPKFKSKSKEERKKMALGAFYAANPKKSKKTVKEDVDSSSFFDLLDKHGFRPMQGNPDNYIKHYNGKTSTIRVNPESGRWTHTVTSKNDPNANLAGRHRHNQGFEYLKKHLSKRFSNKENVITEETQTFYSLCGLDFDSDETRDQHETQCQQCVDIKQNEDEGIDDGRMIQGFTSECGDMFTSAEERDKHEDQCEDCIEELYYNDNEYGSVGTKGTGQAYSLCCKQFPSKDERDAHESQCTICRDLMRADAITNIDESVISDEQKLANAKGSLEHLQARLKKEKKTSTDAKCKETEKEISVWKDTIEKLKEKIKKDKANKMKTESKELKAILKLSGLNEGEYHYCDSCKGGCNVPCKNCKGCLRGGDCDRPVPCPACWGSGEKDIFRDQEDDCEHDFHDGVCLYCGADDDNELSENSVQSWGDDCKHCEGTGFEPCGECDACLTGDTCYEPMDCDFCGGTGVEIDDLELEDDTEWKPEDDGLPIEDEGEIEFDDSVDESISDIWGNDQSQFDDDEDEEPIVMAPNQWKVGDRVCVADRMQPDGGKKGTVRRVAGGSIKVDLDDGESETFGSRELTRAEDDLEEPEFEDPYAKYDNTKFVDEGKKNKAAKVCKKCGEGPVYSSGECSGCFYTNHCETCDKPLGKKSKNGMCDNCIQMSESKKSFKQYLKEAEITSKKKKS